MQLQERIANLWPVMLAVALAFAIGLRTGFVLHEKYPYLSDRTLALIIVGIILGTAVGILLLLLLILEWAGFRPKNLTLSVRTFFRNAGTLLDPEQRARQESAKEYSLKVYATYKDAKHRRIAELTADPAKHPYITLVEKGEWWSDEQIAYQENRELTATCPHLQAIEHAMRMEGIELRRLGQSWDPAPLAKVRGDCCINETALRQRFPLPESIRHVTGYQPERSEFDNPWAELVCLSCDSKIELTHPECPHASTKWFPNISA